MQGCMEQACLLTRRSICRTICGPPLLAAHLTQDEADLKHRCRSWPPVTRLCCTHVVQHHQHTASNGTHRTPANAAANMAGLSLNAVQDILLPDGLFFVALTCKLPAASCVHDRRHPHLQMHPLPRSRP